MHMYMYMYMLMHMHTYVYVYVYIRLCSACVVSAVSITNPRRTNNEPRM